MHADPAQQRRLLDLQQADTALTQLTHRRNNLPQTAELTRLRDTVNGITDRRARHEATVSDLERDIGRVEREIDQVRKRADRDRERQESGAATAKELSGLGHELQTLARRQSELEDQELDLMEQRETAQREVDSAAAELSESTAALADLEAQRDAAAAELDLQLSAQRTARDAIVAAITDTDLLALYDRIRRTKPIAVALLRHRRCESCRIEQSGGELAELRAAAPDDVVRCDNCRAILIRGEESGL